MPIEAMPETVAPKGIVYLAYGQLSPRLRHVLQNLVVKHPNFYVYPAIDTVRQLAALGRTSLRKQQDIDEACLAEAAQVCEQHGYELAA